VPGSWIREKKSNPRLKNIAKSLEAGLIVNNKIIITLWIISFASFRSARALSLQIFGHWWEIWAEAKINKLLPNNILLIDIFLANICEWIYFPIYYMLQEKLTSQNVRLKNGN